jgi:hypothetical protein
MLLQRSVLVRVTYDYMGNTSCSVVAAVRIIYHPNVRKVNVLIQRKKRYKPFEIHNDNYQIHTKLFML